MDEIDWEEQRKKEASNKNRLSEQEYKELLERLDLYYMYGEKSLLEDFGKELKND